jgi:chromosome segregation ATPase
VQSDNTSLRGDLAATVARGDAVAAKIRHLAGGLSAGAAKVAKLKAECVVAEGWASLYGVALEGIAFEAERHDQQRDDIVEKLRSIIADVHAENESQVEMMERHSRDIVGEAKANLAATYEQRGAAMALKYTKLRKLLEAQHELGDDALASHQSFLEEHYRSKFEEKHEALSLQTETLEGEVALLLEEESALAGQVSELGAEAVAFEGELSQKDKANKDLQRGVTALHSRIGSLRDAIGEAKLELEEGERKGRKVEMDYEMLTAKNHELADEIDRFGDMLQRAEQALSAAPKGSKLPAMAAIYEGSGEASEKSPGAKAQRGGAASPASKRKAETPKSSSSAKATTTPKASPPKVAKASGGSGKKAAKK